MHVSCTNFRRCFQERGIIVGWETPALVELPLEEKVSDTDRDIQPSPSHTLNHHSQIKKGTKFHFTNTQLNDLSAFTVRAMVDSRNVAIAFSSILKTTVMNLTLRYGYDCIFYRVSHAITMQVCTVYESTVLDVFTITLQVCSPHLSLC